MVKCARRKIVTLRSPRPFVAVLAWLFALLVPCSAGSQSEEATVTNLARPAKWKADSLALEIRDRNLALGGLQLGNWADPAEPLDLSALEGIKAPCRSLRIDAAGMSVLTVCPTTAGNERVLMTLQGVVLQLPLPVKKGTNPSISDDGVRAAAIFDEEGASVLHVVDVQRTRDMAVLGLDEPRHPILAGEGTVVACTAMVGGKRHAVVIDLETGQGHVLSDGQREVDVGALSANGRRVVYKAFVAPHDDFYLVDLDRSIRFNISDSEGSAVAVDLSQNGDTVAYISSFGGAYGVFTADINARKMINRIGLFKPVRDVYISASGQRFAILQGSERPVFEVWDTHGKVSNRVHVIDEGCEKPTLASSGLVAAALCPSGDQRAARLQLYTLPDQE